MSTTRRKLAGGALALVTAGAGMLAPTAAPAQAVYMTDLHARLHATNAYPNARGGAEYRSGYHMGREFEIWVNGIKPLAGKTVRVYVHGDFLSGMRVSHYGSAHLFRHNGVPAIRSGQSVQVRTKPGKLVTYGTFRRHRHHHMIH